MTSNNNKILSEVYFNRSMLWILIGYAVIQSGQNKWIVVCDFAIAAFYIIRSAVIGLKE